ncbi:hypothetical protein BUE76_09395 [Cnuella takakiae]|nr:hypothetical protein BUE76_09395 [Cnuella takakiae]
MLLIMVSAFTCNKDSRIVAAKSLPTYTYAQTQCADPWPTSPNDSVTAGNVRQYLKERGVEVSFVSVKKTSEAATCLACTCPSGKTIFVGASDEATTVKLLNQVGFK